MDSAAVKTCENAIENFNYYIDDFESLRNQFYADGQDGISVLTDEDGNSFCIAIDESGNDVLITYFNAKDNDYTEFRYKNGNNFYNSPVNVDYSEIINAYIFLRQKEKDTKSYEFVYDDDGNITGTQENNEQESVWGDSYEYDVNADDAMPEDAYIWGITDTAGLYKYVSEESSKNEMFKVSYKLGDDDTVYDTVDTKDSKNLANNSDLATENGYNHYYQIEVSVSTYSSEVVTIDEKSGLSYSRFVQNLFDLTDDEMEEVAQTTLISNAIIQGATVSGDNLEIPADFSEYFILSPAKKIFDNLLNGKSVLQQMTENGLIMDNLSETVCRNLVVGKALTAHNMKLAVSYENWLGIKNNDTFTKYFGDNVENAKVGDSGLFTTYCFYTALANSTLTLRDSLFKTDDNTIIYESQDYAQYLNDKKLYYSGNKVDTTSKTKIAPGDLLFFGVNYHTEILTDANGNPLAVPSITDTMEPNTQVGIVTEVNGTKITVVVYNWIDDRNINTGTDLFEQLFNWGLDSLLDKGSYVTSKITVDVGDSEDPYLSYVSGYGKPDYAGFVKEYNEKYAKEIENLQNSSSVINASNGSGTLAYPTTYRELSAGYPDYSDGSYHGGIDFPCALGTPVYAAEKGTVIAAKKLKDSYGYYIMIDHGNGLVTLYAHNSELLVKAGDKVARGQLISKSGSTGNSTGPHLHFEVRVNNNRVNPLTYLQES